MGWFTRWEVGKRVDETVAPGTPAAVDGDRRSQPRGSALQVLGVATRLGLASFEGEFFRYEITQLELLERLS
jgi:hypothetical protein